MIPLMALKRSITNVLNHSSVAATMNVLILTGAGISAESGIPTFRDADGLWEGHRFEDVATPEAFERDPKLVHTFYNARRNALLAPAIKPNPAHLALAEWETWHRENDGGQFLLVTQNIDGLHRRAGNQSVLAMHGELLVARCAESGELFDWTDELWIDTPHPDDPGDKTRAGLLRPHVVWFGEMPIGLSQIENAAAQADLFVSIGTSSLVYPAAGIVSQTRPDCRRVEINLQTTAGSTSFDEMRQGPASTEVPKFVAEQTANCQ